MWASMAAAWLIQGVSKQEHLVRSAAASASKPRLLFDTSGDQDSDQGLNKSHVPASKRPEMLFYLRIKQVFFKKMFQTQTGNALASVH